MPRALIEAMSRGCPCIGSNAGGIPELLPPRYIFPKGDADRLAELLLSARENGLLDQGPRNQAFTEQFSPDVIQEKRRAFYHEFLNCRMRQVHHE
jgi:glycosyltransferase involved in cell wall biosynthesis